MEILITLAIIPIIVIAIIMYKADKIEKEPKRELLKAFLMGVVSVVLTLIISFVFKIDTYDYSDNYFKIFIYSFFGISLIEELSKWLCTYLFLRKNKNFDYIFDGIVYSVFIALGFATIENLLYTISGGVSTGIIRAITTVPAHVFFAISCGYFMTMYKTENKKIFLLLSILIPFILHGFYDFCLLTSNIIFFYIYLIFIVSLYSFSIYRVRKTMDEDRKM